MRVTIDQQQEQIIDATFEQVDYWWKQATSSIFQQEKLIQYVTIDGRVMYDGYEQYLVQNLVQIKEVDISTLSRMESIQETEKSISEYLERFIPAAQNITDQLFGVIGMEQQNLFARFVEGLGWIVNALEFNKTLYNQIADYEPEYLKILERLELVINEMCDNVERKDYVAVGDLIQYEIIPLMRDSQNKMEMSALS